VFGGAKATPAADCFAFGVVLWELLTWECPWGKQNPWTVRTASAGMWICCQHLQCCWHPTLAC
jgi:hypothetical protein